MQSVSPSTMTLKKQSTTEKQLQIHSEENSDREKPKRTGTTQRSEGGSSVGQNPLKKFENLLKDSYVVSITKRDEVENPGY